MTQHRVHVIVNPSSARGRTGRRWPIIKNLIHHYFKEYRYVFTERPRQAIDITRELLKEGYDLIIGIGGDGTLNEITNGFFGRSSRKIINDQASLGIIPSGTGSDFINFLKIPSDFKKSIELIKHSDIKKIDIGRVTYLSEPTGTNQRFFINVADFGLGAEVIKNLSAKTSKGPLSYYTGLLRSISHYSSKAVKLIIDGEREISGPFLIGAIANGRYFGNGMKIAPFADLSDGFFDLVLVQDMKKFEVIRNSRLLYTGNLQKNPKVSIIKAKTIEITSNELVNIETDGELGKTLPAKFEILEKAIKFRF